MKPCDTIITQMSEAIDNRLDGKALAAFTAHLDACEACRREYDALRQTVSLLWAMPAADAPADMPACVRRRLEQSHPSRFCWTVLYRPATRIALAASLLVGISIYAFLRPEPATHPESEVSDQVMMRKPQQDQLPPVEMSEDRLSRQPDSPPMPDTPREPESTLLTHPAPAPAPPAMTPPAPDIRPLQPDREHVAATAPQPSWEELREEQPPKRRAPTDAVRGLRSPAPAASRDLATSRARRQALHDESDGRQPAAEREIMEMDSVDTPQALDFSIAGEGIAAAGPTAIRHDKLRNANPGFAADMYRELAKTHDGNIFFSPDSVSAVLTMLSAGTDGQPADYLSRKGSNALCLTGGAVSDDYKALLQDRYDASLFDGDQSVVNAWAARKTHGRIPVTLGQLSPGSIGIVLNAIYFNGIWQDAFDPLETHPAAFQASPDRSIATPMLVRKGHYRLLKSDGFQAVSIPYRDAAVSMIVFLPDAKTELDTLENRLTGSALAGWLTQLSRNQPQPLRLIIPAFKIEAYPELVQPSRGLGMREMFTEGVADFTGMGWPDGELWISRIKHRIFFDVNETGTDVAAVTAGEMTTTPPAPTAAATPTEPTFRAERPFIFLIQDNQTHAILFMGRLHDPAD